MLEYDKIDISKDYYENNKELPRERAKNKYKEININKYKEYGKNRYHNMSEEKM